MVLFAENWLWDLENADWGGGGLGFGWVDFLPEDPVKEPEGIEHEKSSTNKV